MISETITLTTFLIAILGVGGNVVSAFCLLCFLFLCRTHLRNTKSTVSDLALVLSCVFVAMSCFHSIEPALSAVSVIDPAVCVLALLCSRLLVLEEICILILYYCGIFAALSITHFFLSLYAAPQIALTNLPLFRREVVGLTGIASGEHPLGVFAIAPSILLLVLLFRKKMSWPELLILSMAIACALLTFSRGVYLSALVGMAMLLPVLIDNDVRKSKRQLTLLGCSVGVAIFTLLVIPPIRHGILVTAHPYSNASQERSTLGRAALYHADLLNLANVGFLGTGPGTYGFSRNGRQFQALNSFIQIIAEYGALTLCAFVVFLVSEITATFRTINEREFKYIVVSVLLAATVINSTWSALLTERPTMMLVALFLAFVRAVRFESFQA